MWKRKRKRKRIKQQFNGGTHLTLLFNCLGSNGEKAKEHLWLHSIELNKDKTKFQRWRDNQISVDPSLLLFFRKEIKSFSFIYFWCCLCLIPPHAAIAKSPQSFCSWEVHAVIKESKFFWKKWIKIGIHHGHGPEI